MGGGGGKSGGRKKSKVGFEYYMAGIFGLCEKATRLLKVVYGERVAWSGSATDGTEFTVNAFNLYGGTETGGSGGLKGQFIFQCGNPGQSANRVMRKYLGEDCPAHRGIATVSMDKSFVAAFSPTFRQTYFLLENLGGYGWREDIQTIAGSQINPAHEIRDVLTNPDLCGQFSVSELDDSSFQSAAQKLYNERFGLSPVWKETTKAQEYVNELLKHIDGILVRDRSTGRLKLKLNRADYGVGSLPVINESHFSEIKSLGTVSAASMVNKLTIKYARLTDIGEETATLTGENLANIAMQGGIVNSSEVEYKHLTNAISDLPGRILARDLRAQSYPLRSFTLVGTSALSSYEEGDVVKFQAPSIGIQQIVCRVLEVDYGTQEDHRVTLTLTEDIYGTDVTSFIAQDEPEWQNPFSAPTVPSTATLIEMPLALALQNSPRTELAWWTGQYPYAGFVMSIARRNLVIDKSYTHKVLESNVWKEYGEGSFCESVVLSSYIGRTETSIFVGDTSSLGLSADVDQYGLVGTEIVKIVSWSSNTLTVVRGILDTLPQVHNIGDRLWIVDDTKGGVCTKQYTSGNKASIALQTANSVGKATISSTDCMSLTLAARAFRPYPPGGLSFNGTYLAEEITGALTVSWKHRSRIDLLDNIVSQTSAHVGPENGTTYTLELYDENGTKRKSLTGLTEPSYTWDTEASDCGFNGGIQTVWCSTSTSNGAATSYSVTLPSSVKGGDLLVAHVMSRADAATPEGWTLNGESETFDNYNQRETVFIRTATASDAGKAYTWTIAESARINVIVTVFRSSSPIEVGETVFNIDRNTSDAVFVLPTLTNLDIGLVVFSSSTSWVDSSLNFTSTIGSIVSTASGSDVRNVVGVAKVSDGGTFSGTMYNGSTYMTNQQAATSATPLKYTGTGAPKYFNGTVRVRLWAVRDGYSSWQVWDATVRRPKNWVKTADGTVVRDGNSKEIYVD